MGAGAAFSQGSQDSEVLDSYLARLEEVNFESKPLPHYTGEAGEDKGRLFYVFQSRKLQTSAVGFGGPVDLIIVVGSNQFIQEIVVEDSQETPHYLEKVEPWLAVFKGKPLAGFTASEVPVDTVTHATYSSGAVLETISDSARIILNDFFKQEVQEALPKKITGLWEAVALILFSFAGVFLFFKSRSKKIRYIFLFLLVLAVGFGFNLQLSFRHIISLLSFRLPVFTYPALLGLIFIPFILGLFCGRIYCGWLCPFGALQELLGGISRPIKVSKKIEKKVRYIKYIFLAGLVFLFFFKKDVNIYPQDPLGRVFGAGDFFAWDNFLVWIALFFSLFFVRFWCRYFCVVGAFLSLLNKTALFKFVFKKNFSRCPWHADKRRDLSCTLCNKCQNQ